MKEDKSVNRWQQRFGNNDDSPVKFAEYLAKRLWRVRGDTIDTEHPDKQKANDKYIKSLVEETGYWTDAKQIKGVVQSVLSMTGVADDYEYTPLAEEIINSKDGNQVFFNRYRTPYMGEVEPSVDERKLWDDYWLYLLPALTERSQVQQWVAHLAFKPDVRTGVAILLHGVSNGTGKGTLGEVLTELVGKTNSEKPTNPNEVLTGRFNAALADKVLFIVDELYAGGSFKMANGIKSKITEPTLSIEPKGQEPRTIVNFCNFLATSNHMTPIWLDKEDRRWEVFNVEFLEGKEVEHKQAAKAFRAWFEADREHATKVIRYILSEVDLTDYHPERNGAVETEAKRRLVKNSVSSTEDDFGVYWYENEFNGKLVVNATALFKEDWKGVKAGQRSEILTNIGCRKFDSTGNIKIGGVQSRNWWITPLGLKHGITPHMTGGEAGEVLQEKLVGVTNVFWDAHTDTLDVTTNMTTF